MVKIIPILICWWFCSIAPVVINIESAPEEIIFPTPESLVKPIKTYHLSILGEGRREISLDPPATKIVVTSQSGDTTVRCGDDSKAYSCSPGKRLELEYDTVTPLAKFWGENISQNQVRLQIDVYQTVSLN